jgi:hypothetical protein
MLPEAPISVIVKVFGRWPSRTFPPALRPASENLQGRKPRGKGHVLGRCRALSYGDLAWVGPRMKSAGRRGEWPGWRCRSGATRFSDLGAGVSLKISGAVAW